MNLSGFPLTALTRRLFGRDRYPKHLLAEIAAAVRTAAGDRQVYLVAESESQQVRLVQRPKDGGFGLDSIWKMTFTLRLSLRLLVEQRRTTATTWETRRNFFPLILLVELEFTSAGFGPLQRQAYRRPFDSHICANPFVPPARICFRNAETACSGKAIGSLAGCDIATCQTAYHSQQLGRFHGLGKMILKT